MYLVSSTNEYNNGSLRSHNLQLRRTTFKLPRIALHSVATETLQLTADWLGHAVSRTQLRGGGSCDWNKSSHDFSNDLIQMGLKLTLKNSWRNTLPTVNISTLNGSYRLILCSSAVLNCISAIRYRDRHCRLCIGLRIKIRKLGLKLTQLSINGLC
jgi:hypothetical protein